MTDESVGGSAHAALKGVKVLDLSRLLPAGYCSLLLSWMGAEVTKVERPGDGDGVRTVAPMVGSSSRLHYALNGNKRSLVLDLKTEAGLREFKRLARDSDVIIENFRPSVTTRLGVSYADIRALNPRIVYCSVTGFGHAGARTQTPGFDLSFVARAGLLEYVGRMFDGALQPPEVPVSDIVGGSQAALAVVGALMAREATGEGEWIDFSLTDSLLHSWVAMGLDPRDAQKASQERSAVAGIMSGYAVFLTADGRSLAVAAETPVFWHRLCEITGCLDLAAQDPMTQGMAAIGAYARLAAVFESKDLDEWTAALAGADIPFEPVLTPAEAVRLGLEAGRESVIRSRTDEGAEVAIPGRPWVARSVATSAMSRAPALGEHGS